MGSVDTRKGWRDICHEAQEERDASIRLVSPAVPQIIEAPANVISVPKQVLTEEEVAITELLPEDLVSQLAVGKLSSRVVVNAFLRRAGVAQRLTNCIVELLPIESLQRARELDEYLEKNGKPIGPLHGLPISVKEHIGIEGCRLTAGFVSWWEKRAPEDAHILRILTEAGAVPFARTTEPQTLMHLETSSNLYGVTVNPHNTALTSGGSSGGEGALLGMRGSCLGIGTDIGGSIRSPAANCGVYGLRPTSYRIPVRGWGGTMLAEEQIVAVMGPLSTSIKGIELLMKTVLAAKPWLVEPSCLPIPWRDQESHLGNPRRLKIGIMWTDGVVQPHPPITRALQEIKARLQHCNGTEVVDWIPYDTPEAWKILANLYFCDNANEEREAIDASGEPWRPLSEWIIKRNPEVSHKTIEEVWHWTAQREKYRAKYAEKWNMTGSLEAGKAPEDGRSDRPVDVILCPVGPGAAPPLDCSTYWPYTSLWNLLDYPALVFPATTVDPNIDPATWDYKPQNTMDQYNYQLWTPERYEQVPVSLQLVGRRYEDEKVIEAYKYIESKMRASPLEPNKPSNPPP